MRVLFSVVDKQLSTGKSEVLFPRISDMECIFLLVLDKEIYLGNHVSILTLTLYTVLQP